MKQTTLTILLIAIIIGLLSIVIFGSKYKTTDTAIRQTPTDTNSSISSSVSTISIFFYGNSCPHCEDVEEWMMENNIEERIELMKKEVYDNRANSLELAQAAESCGLPTDNIGVPFLYTEGKCIIGTPDIINYLSEKGGLISPSGSAERSTE